ncbi:MAG: AI-2E family transporter [Bosea sp. (in: a-proteobacteria)]|uniref:AI-2E family transporter n=1 Tax=unclassified Bosea (in: a-proteobacteria) TaxID=2653178 RepID=UPI0009695603|nr:MULTISPECIES: AI-2E family transporter [unclassified Bosea (in: a-proteobacteria)]MBN9445203.1 AI-2E family transporter [Bosea sp. (in: a-proteobacteria)]MBN9458354.1 AI-2E family transporter [Bosea sp. (in: a-proteobacteria)]OJV06928.1 MAG: AI-2E family transporter [Bosea sp. 67-29]
MTLQRQIGFWLGSLIVFVLFLVLLRDILLPFIAALALAYLLDPLADRLERVGLSRLAATIVILVVAILIFALVLILLVPLLGQQLAGLVARLPEDAAKLQTLVLEKGAPWLERFGGGDLAKQAQSSLGDLVGQATKWVGGLLQSLWTGGTAIVGVFSLLVLTPVIAFYLLVDWDRMVATVDTWLPRDHRETIRGLVREMDTAIAGFLRGQALVCLLLGTFYAIGLSVVGVNFGALIGIISGFLSFIPYVGSLTGLVLSVGVAIVQFWPDWTWPLAALGVFLVGQFLEGNIFQPKFVGDSIGVHPVWLMFALLAFGTLFGFVGLLLAVPLAAVIGVLCRFALRQYLASNLYRGIEPPRPKGIEVKIDLER